MRKALVVLALTLNTAYLPAGLFEGVLDEFISPSIAYSTRSSKIKEQMISALNTGGKKWGEEGEAWPSTTGMDFKFIPRNQYPTCWYDKFDYTPQDKFTYSEYDSKKDKRRRIDDINSFVNLVAVEKEENHNWYTLTILSQTDQEVAFELNIKPKPHKYTSSKVDEDGFKVTENKEKVHPEKAGTQVIGKAFSLGNGKYTFYKYESKNKKLRAEEAAYWLQMIDYVRIYF